MSRADELHAAYLARLAERMTAARMREDFFYELLRRQAKLALSCDEPVAPLVLVRSSGRSVRV